MRRCQAGFAQHLVMKTATLPNRFRVPRAGKPAKAKAADRPLRVRSVLVPIDFSKPSRMVMDYILPFIKEFGAELHLVHVFERDYPFTSMMALPLVVPELEVGQRARTQLKNMAKNFSVEVRPENIHAVRGTPFEEICRIASDRNIDLIAIATRGNIGLKYLALGSTADKVVRYSPCPVLVIPPGERNRSITDKAGSQSPLRISRIVVPVDFSECSLNGLAYAKALAKKFGSWLVILNSVALQYWITSDEYSRYDFPVLMRRAEELAKDQMEALIRNTDWDGIKVEASLQIGHAGDQICAQGKQADMIVTSTHGITGFKHILLGSTAEYVVRHAFCPVLVVPSHSRPIPKAKLNKERLKKLER